MEAIISFTRDHAQLAILIVFVLAFCESFSFVSLIVPATTILLGIGVLVSAAHLNFWLIWSGTVLGAIAGAHLAYTLGYRYKTEILKQWPMRRYPNMMSRGGYVFHKYGVMAVFMSRFSAPARATVPTVAGMYQLPFIKFQLANVGSAILWSTLILAPGLLWPS